MCLHELYGRLSRLPRLLSDAWRLCKDCRLLSVDTLRLSAPAPCLPSAPAPRFPDCMATSSYMAPSSL